MNVTGKSHESILHTFQKSYRYVGLENVVNISTLRTLPFCIRIMLENIVRNVDDVTINNTDIENIINWREKADRQVIIPFKPSRVIANDISGTSMILDLAVMRESLYSLGGDYKRMNPLIPTVVAVERSVRADHTGNQEALEKNQELEFQRHKERFRFLKWASKAFQGLLVLPSGSGTLNQLNVESLSPLVMGTNTDFIFPDSVIGAHSQTTTVGAIGILAWDVTTMDAYKAMMGHPILIEIPQVMGCRIKGMLKPLTTSTDLALTVLNHLKARNVNGKIVEFFGPGIVQLPIPYRVAICNMCPYLGIQSAYFPVDYHTLHYLSQTKRSPGLVKIIEDYLKANHLMVSDLSRGDASGNAVPNYSEVMDFDLSNSYTSLTGPNSLSKQISVDSTQGEFIDYIKSQHNIKIDHKTSLSLGKMSLDIDGKSYHIRHGDVVSVAIAGCLTTCNPFEMIGAGIIAKKAVEIGLKIKPFVKTSFSPGSATVLSYLSSSGLLPYLNRLGFYVSGFGSMASGGEGGPLHESLASIVASRNIVTVDLVSGREGWPEDISNQSRIPVTYVASAPLIIAYALAGTVCIELDLSPLGTNRRNDDIYLRDIWPTQKEILTIYSGHWISSIYPTSPLDIQVSNRLRWSYLKVTDTPLFAWSPENTFICRPPFLESVTVAPPLQRDIINARVLLFLEDSISRSMIFPTGSILRSSPSGQYLSTKDVKPINFGDYKDRIGNCHVMVRSVFSSDTIKNKLLSSVHSNDTNTDQVITPFSENTLATLHLPSGETLSVHHSANKYRKERVPLIILVGKQFGFGKAIDGDWAVKGLAMLGVQAVIAESYGSAFNQNLSQMGILPLEFQAGENAEHHRLTGRELYTIQVGQNLSPKSLLAVEVDDGKKKFHVLCRIDTVQELNCYKAGGVLPELLRLYLK